jgi:phage baseplate assembly protein W
MAEVEVPQLAVPFAFTATGVATVEQGSPEDIEGCIQNVLACPVGVSVERPGFGITRPQFQNAPLDARRLMEQVVRWEPRASLEALENVLGEQERGVVLEVSP